MIKNLTEISIILTMLFSFGCSQDSEKLKILKPDLVLALEKDLGPAFILKKYPNGKLEIVFRSTKRDTLFETFLAEENSIIIDSSTGSQLTFLLDILLNSFNNHIPTKMFEYIIGVTPGLRKHRPDIKEVFDVD